MFWKLTDIDLRTACIIARAQHHTGSNGVPDMLTKPDTIDAIKKMNPTVNPAFLAEFSNEDLQEYLTRLTRMRTEKSDLRKANPRQSENFLKNDKVCNG